jgi:metal-responsive CopG/Arc/MetJ family transcriptional regulator
MQTQVETQDHVFVSGYFPADLALKIRIAAAKRNVSRSELMRRAAAAYLKDEQNRGPQRKFSAGTSVQSVGIHRTKNRRICFPARITRLGGL